MRTFRKARACTRERWGGRSGQEGGEKAWLARRVWRRRLFLFFFSFEEKKAGKEQERGEGTVEKRLGKGEWT